MTISEDELERIKTKADKTIHIIHFAKMSEIDPILFEKIIMWFQSLEEKRHMNYCGRHCLAKSRLQ